MYEESCLRYKKKMCIEALDVVKSYEKDEQHLKMAVSITDVAGYPVFESDVELVLDSPNGTKISLTNETDPFGIALFEISNVERGRWEVIVFNVHHPDYCFEKSDQKKSWSITYI